MGTIKGILAVEGLTNPACVNDLPWQPPTLMSATEHYPGNPEAGDPQVIEAVIEALKRETLGGSFIRREYEKECRALLKGSVRRIALFTYDPKWRDKRPPEGWSPLSTTWVDDWEVEDDPGHGNFNKTERICWPAADTAPSRRDAVTAICTISLFLFRYLIGGFSLPYM
jgi:hypothetical protein